MFASGHNFREKYFNWRVLCNTLMTAVLDVLNEHSETKCHLIVFLKGSDMGDPGHHTLQMLTRAIISYGAFQKIQFTKSICTQQMQISANFSSRDQHQ
jgi:hypothetical protein